jgi:cytochrome bd-type quinol oxidase subunit 2
MLIFRPLKYAYRELISNRRRQIPFWVLLGFLPSYLTARLLVHFAPGLFFHVHGVHVHHFTYGIIVLAIFYGIGLALSFDEFGMWVRLTDHYNIDQSEDVMAGILVFLVFARLRHRHSPPRLALYDKTIRRRLNSTPRSPV